ncbi:hypothetical protein [Aureivirga sp. CE67]|uniref:hypothetical protein n=1 Tax=Aureivirga sp. CE67 TaxID=1788983 RepID=UPI0018CBE097|nr:hypothetical protein [Aureivirga sp. CE67]
MSWNISMILIDKKLDEDAKIEFVRKYYKSYIKGSNTSLELSLNPKNNSIYIGNYGNSTIITHFEIPLHINWEVKDIGKFEKKHNKTSKLCKTFDDCNIFCVYLNSVGTVFNYSFFKNGERIRHKRNQIKGNFDLCEEVGSLLMAEQEYYSFSKIKHIEKGREVNYGKKIGILHKTYYCSREYYSLKRINNEEESLSEFQCAYEVIMNTTKQFLNRRLDEMELENILMIEYCKK